MLQHVTFDGEGTGSYNLHMSAHLVSLGMSVAFDGRLKDLRERLGMSRTTMAGLMGVSAESLRKWESGRQGMKVDTALRIAKWWQQVQVMLTGLGTQVQLSELVPIVSVVAHLGVSQQKVMQWCHDGELAYEDLGPLGYCIYRSEIPALVTGKAS